MDLMVDIILELLSTFLDVTILWLYGGGIPLLRRYMLKYLDICNFQLVHQKIYIDSKTLTIDVL